MNKVSARSIGGAPAASILVRVEPGLSCIMCLTIAYPSELETQLRLQVYGRPIETWLSRDEAGRTVVGVFVPDNPTRAHDAEALRIDEARDWPTLQ